MTPEYLEHLAKLADPDDLWRLDLLKQIDLTVWQKERLDTGIALRRHASHMRNLNRALDLGRSLCITPLNSNGTATMTIDPPPGHVRLIEAAKQGGAK